ncbi:hypothetical protein AB0J83_24350 [Actinoplanes sp. NPDC049596]|uniref:hypothetical protein n=1 Tax=unclassified Actinoplanes TaxID=2626549 RepID=UPI00342A9CEF
MSAGVGAPAGGVEAGGAGRTGRVVSASADGIRISGWVTSACAGAETPVRVAVGGAPFVCGAEACAESGTEGRAGAGPAGFPLLSFADGAVDGWAVVIGCVASVGGAGFSSAVDGVDGEVRGAASVEGVTAKG